jgi:phytoene synthase
MKANFDLVSARCSILTTRLYSTSFSLGIRFLDKEFRQPVYAIYGFVRFADEIVDSFHDYDKALLLQKFREDTYEAIDKRISLNPILNSFQDTVHRYAIDRELIDTFLHSMEMDLHKKAYTDNGYEQYIFGSAEVVGLMCLRVFTRGDEASFRQLRPAAMKLGSAFQKVNFLRDVKADYEELGRTYFPGVNLCNFSPAEKKQIEADIEQDFEDALHGIRALPPGSRRGIYLAYFYYRNLFGRIKRTHADQIMQKRIRIPDSHKVLLMCQSFFRHQLNIL